MEKPKFERAKPIKLTKSELARLPAPDPSGSPRIVWDAEVPGFGVLLSGVTSARSFIVQWTPPASQKGGRRKVIRRTVSGVATWLSAGRTIEDARNEAADLLLHLRKGDDPKRRLGSLTVSGALDLYVKTRSNLRKNSKDAMRSIANRYLSDWLDTPLRDITGDMVEKRHGEIQREIAVREQARQRAAAKRDEKRAKSKGPAGRARPPQGDGAIKRTGHHAADSAMVVLRALWNLAAERDQSLHAMPNPVARLRRAWFRSPQKDRRERRVRSEQLPAFYKAVTALPSTTARDYILMLLFTGLRRREAASLKWDYVDFVDRVIHVPAERTKAGRKLDLPMNDLVHDLLVARRAVGKEEYVFPGDGKDKYIAEPRYPLGEVAKATGIYVSAHDLRRTFIGIAESTEMSAFALKALVNHAGGDVTEGYLGDRIARLREPAQRVADRIRTLCAIVPPPAGGKVRRLRS